MKKIIIILFIASLGIIFFKKSEDIIIPNSAIRFRVIANSNTLEDQMQKMKIKDNIEREVYELIDGATNSMEVGEILKNNINEIEKITNKYGVPYKINYGMNYFPSKSYKGIVYGAGNYESLVITLGEGLGDNYWCVLFPPLCLINDDKNEISDVDYQLYVKKLLNKF